MILQNGKWSDANIEALGPAAAMCPLGPGTVLEIMGDSHLWELREAGAHVLLALRPSSTSAGMRLDLMGMVSLGDRVPAAVIGHALDDLQRQYAAPTMAAMTRIPHVVNLAERCGFKATGTLLMRQGRVQ